MTSILKHLKFFITAFLFAACVLMMPLNADAQRPSLGGIDNKLDGLGQDLQDHDADLKDQVDALRLAVCIGLESARRALLPPGTCPGIFVGFADWSRDATTQNDAQQDALMDAACIAAFPQTRAATIDEIVAGILGIPATNTRI